MNFTPRIGQVLFNLPKGSTRLVAVRVTEEVVRKTLKADTEVTFIVQPIDSDNPVLLSSLNGDTFASAEEAFVVLTERATTAIGKMIEGVVHRAKVAFPDYDVPAPVSPGPKPQVRQSTQSGGTLLVDESGETFRVKMPEGFDES